MTPFHDLLAFGLATAQRLDLPVYSIECGHRGATLRIWLDEDGDTAAVRRLAEALGVTDAVEHPGPSVFSVSSRARRHAWEKDQDPLDFTGASVEFGDRLVEVTVLCSVKDGQ